MPREKNFKRLVRSRMAKTGESYTTARSRFAPPPKGQSRPVGDPDAGALARALAAVGVVNPISGSLFTEELLFGLGGGIGFSYMAFVYDGWTSTNLDGRVNALYFEKKGFIESACSRLGLPVRVQQLPSPELAERRLSQALETAREIALTVDLARLPGHTTSVEGPFFPYFPYLVTVSEGQADLIVTGLPDGPATMERPELVEVRWTHAKKYGGLFQIGQQRDATDVRTAVTTAIGRTANALLEPGDGKSAGNFGIPGIRKWARLLTDTRDPRGWPQLFANPESLQQALASVVRGLGVVDPSGTASRQLYAAFLEQAATLLDQPQLAEVAGTYRDLGRQWAELVQLAGQPDTSAADLAIHLPDLADAEHAAAAALRAVTQSATTTDFLSKGAAR